MEVKGRYKQTEVGEIPEDWETGRLKEYFSFISYGFTNPMPTVANGIFLITATDINNGEIQYDSSRFTSEFAYRTLLSSKSKPKKNDILLTKDGSLGRLAIVGDKVICINQSVAVIRPNHKVVPIFLKFLLESPTYQKKMLDDAGGSTIKHIYITIVNMMTIALPQNRAEQTAIATVLSDTDALIQSMEKLITKKRAIKQGTMQELLKPKEGWVLKTLGEETILITKGTTPTSLGKSFTESGISFIKVESLEKNGNIIPDMLAFIDEDTHRLLKRSQLKENDLLISIAGALGRVGIVKKDVLPSNTNQALAIVRLKEHSEINLIYVFYYLRTEKICKQIEAISVQGAQLNLSLQNIFDLPIEYPNKSEQIRIANILADMDTEIAALETKNAKYKQVKQCTMQTLLTGRIRLV